MSLMPALAAEWDVRSIDQSQSEGSSAAVIVPDVPQLHTVQILPVDRQGKPIGANRPSEQIDHVFGKLEGLLRLGHDDPARIIKINVVAASNDIADQVRRVFAGKFAKGPKPAVTYVVGKLRYPDALVAMDAVAVHPRAEKLKSMSSPELPGPQTHAHLSLLPAGPKVYVSGQAEKGKDIAEMTRRTMESLAATLKHLGLELKDVVQVKSFLGPMTSVDDAEREIASFFKDSSSVPPLAFVEWTTEPSIEIELIAGRGQGAGPVGDSVDFVTPPGMQASPVFSRVARLAAGPTIYISGMYGDSRDNGEAEIREIFAHLGKLLEKTGSDFRHLAKATYYVSTNEASTKLGTIRPEFYDPKRPPAASKAPVTSTGREGRTITLDMIAVPKLPSP
jgi:enamine deaminase RidA (YjgF/YER057c/UK114 family)